MNIMSAANMADTMSVASIAMKILKTNDNYDKRETIHKCLTISMIRFLSEIIIWFTISVYLEKN